MVDKGHRLAGTALIWYVPVNQNKVSQKLPVPPMMEIASVEQMERGKEIYQQQRLARNHTYTSTEKVETQKGRFNIFMGRVVWPILSLNNIILSLFYFYKKMRKNQQKNTTNKTMYKRQSKEKTIE